MTLASPHGPSAAVCDARILVSSKSLRRCRCGLDLATASMLRRDFPFLSIMHTLRCCGAAWDCPAPVGSGTRAHAHAR